MKGIMIWCMCNFACKEFNILHIRPSLIFRWFDYLVQLMLIFQLYIVFFCAGPNCIENVTVCKVVAASTELLKSKCLKVTCSAAQEMKKCIFFVKVTSIKAKIKLSIRTYAFKSLENITSFFYFRLIVMREVGYF